MHAYALVVFMFFPGVSNAPLTPISSMHVPMEDKKICDENKQALMDWAKKEGYSIKTFCMPTKK